MSGVLNRTKTRLARRCPWLRRLRHPTHPIPLGLWLINVFVQRILRINNATPWMVHFTSRVVPGHGITIGKNVWVSFAVSGGCYFQSANGIEIGDETIFAPNVCIISANHDPTDLHRHLPAHPIRIGRRCWIGANAVILPGVQLGDGVIIGAGAVVTHSFPDRVVIGGVPARVLPVRHAGTGRDIDLGRCETSC